MTENVNDSGFGWEVALLSIDGAIAEDGRDVGAPRHAFRPMRFILASLLGFHGSGNMGNSRSLHPMSLT
jgi:hypothetical protein